MKKLLGMIVLTLVSSFILPACSSSDGLDEVIMDNNANVSATTDSEENATEKPGDD